MHFLFKNKVIKYLHMYAQKCDFLGVNSHTQNSSQAAYINHIKMLDATVFVKDMQVADLKIY